MRAREKFYFFTFFFRFLGVQFRSFFLTCLAVRTPWFSLLKIRQNIGVLLGITPFYR